MKKNLWGLIIFCSVFIPVCAFTHPHVFIQNALTIVFDQNGMAGIQLKWVFDEMFSNMVIHDYDKNKDGTFSITEIKKIKDEMFSNLKNFHYFTHIKINKDEFKIKSVKDFSACLNDNKLTYTFFIPCQVKADSSYKQIRTSIYDETYYVDIMLADKKPVHFENTSFVDYSYKIADDTKNSYYFGQLFPQEIILKFRKRKTQETK